MKRKILLICAVLLAAAVIFCFVYAPLRLRLYPGDRIRGTVQLTVDGSRRMLNEKSVQNDGGFQIQYTDDGAADVRSRGGDYGDYAFELLLDELDQPIIVCCFQHNWWNVQRFELQITVDTASQTIQYTGHSSDYGSNGKRIADSIEISQTFSDDVYQVLIGL